MNKAAVRRALTTLKKQGIVYRTDIPSNINGKVFIVLEVDAELTQPKKKIYIRKSKNKVTVKKEEFTIIGSPFVKGALIINNNYKNADSSKKNI